ncbi:MAG: histidine kinase [Pyrinomonadaceae bacterium]|nr:histidine kinase [Pyrinomonadaceae bacterium]
MKPAFKKFIIIFLAWTLFGVFFAAQGYANSVFFGKPVPFSLQLSLWLICGYGWMILTPAVHFFSKKFSIKSSQIGRNLLTHLILAVFTALVHLLLFVSFTSLFAGETGNPFSFKEAFARLLFTNFHFDFLVYWALIGIFHLREINRRFVERERETARLALETSQLETRLAEARLEALKMQIQPHFLFNTLNSISVLMRDDVITANKMLIRLSELLRTALKSESSQTISLQEELEFLRGYLEIEQMRFQDRLTVDFAIENETLSAKIPNLLLQPLVENAIRHGISKRAERGKILIESKRNNGFIELCISDNGAGLGSSGNSNNGIGLKNTKERLEKLYGEKQKFEMISGEKEGLQVKIKIPYEQ